MIEVPALLAFVGVAMMIVGALGLALEDRAASHLDD
jgi:hypothetical protein